MTFESHGMTFESHHDGARRSHSMTFESHTLYDDAQLIS